MLDFERQLEGLAVSGRLHAKIKKAAKKFPAKKPVLKSISGKPAAKAKTRIQFTAKRKPTARPKTLQELAASKPPTRSSSARVKVKVSASGKAKVKIKRPAKPSLHTRMPSAARVQRELKKATKPLRVAADTKIVQQLPPEERQKVAARLTLPSLKRLAKKSDIHPKKPQKPREVARKAIEAIKPVTQACKCQAAPVIRNLDAQFVTQGYPIGTAAQLLASLHDMTKSLEKAAIQRLATHEHNVLTAKHDFEHQVFTRLAEIAKCLPTCHPTRTRAHLSILRKA